jgi:hypothetical protein
VTATVFVLGVFAAILAIVLLFAWSAGVLGPRGCFRVAAIAIAIGCLVVLSGCGQVRPSVPQQVTVVVEKFKPLPAWAKRRLPKPVAASGTVRAHLENEDARGGVIDVANCRAALLERLDAGEQVDEKECLQP